MSRKCHFGILGIGITNPTSLFQINSAAATASYMRFSVNGTTNGMVGTSGGANQIITGDAADDLVLNAKGNMLFSAASGLNTERMRITSGGNVGICIR